MGIARSVLGAAKWQDGDAPVAASGADPADQAEKLSGRNGRQAARAGSDLKVGRRRLRETQQTSHVLDFDAVCGENPVGFVLAR
jgi:hypothetical protein